MSIIFKTDFSEVAEYGQIMTLYKGTKSEVTGIYYESSDLLLYKGLDFAENTVPSSFDVLYVTPDKNFNPKEIHTSKNVPFILGVFLYRPAVNPEIKMTHHSDNDSWKSINGRFKYEIKEIEEVDYETVCKYSRAYRNNKALIVSGFAGVGKTRFTELYKSIYDIIDLDSSYYSWIINEDGTKEKDPNFVANYSQAISELEGYADIIFISTHEDVRKRLKERDIPFITVGPKREAKDQWIERLKKRNPDDRIIPIMEENWDSFLDTLNLDNGLTGKMAIKLNGDQYLDPSWVGPIRNIVIGEPLVIDFGKWG